MHRYQTPYTLWKKIMIEIDKKLGKGVLPLTSNNTMVIVETRKHPHLQPVLKCYAHFLRDWSLHLYYGQDNEDQVKEIVKDWSCINLHKVNVKSILDYNQMLKTKEFWSSLPSNNILIFQTDSLIRNNKIEEFLQYDYVGAPWYEGVKLEDGTFVKVGNGGLSFRKRDVMVKIIEKYLSEDNFIEDGYFSKYLYLDKYNVPSTEIAKKFSVESIYYEDPFGMHKPYKNISSGQLEELLNVFLTNRNV